MVVSKDEWDTKKGTGKSMKNALYCMYNGMEKGTSWAEVISNSKKKKQKKNKPVALAIVKLHESEGIRQLDIQ